MKSENDGCLAGYSVRLMKAGGEREACKMKVRRGCEE